MQASVDGAYAAAREMLTRLDSEAPFEAQVGFVVEIRKYARWTCVLRRCCDANGATRLFLITPVILFASTVDSNVDGKM